jgi:glutamate dehydrogenase
LHAWGDAFPAAYRDDFDAAETMADLVLLQSLEAEGALAVRLSPRDEQYADLKLYGAGTQPSLSEVLPSLTNMGVTVDDERPYDIQPRGLPRRWIKHFRLRVPPHAIATGAVGDLFEDAFLAVLSGAVEDDGFNRLVILAGLSWREVTLHRAYSRYLRQIGTLYSHTYVSESLAAHPDIARALVELFVTRLDPWLDGQGDTDRLVDQLEAALDAVTALDEDRILRSVMHLVLATLRTNWFQSRRATRRRRGRAEARPDAHPDAPLPARCSRSSCAHLGWRRCTCAPVAPRGGIRWSDRRGLPHRDPRPHEGAAREERGHRPERSQGRFRREAAAGRP